MQSTLRSSIRLIFILSICLIAHSKKICAQHATENKSLHQLFDNYYEERLRLYPIEATNQGDSRYNDLLQNDGSAPFLKTIHDFYTGYQNKLRSFRYAELNADDKISYDVMMDITERELGTEKFHPEYQPMMQVYSIPLAMGIMGAGTGAQPFKTVVDYNNWLKRIASFQSWTDTAIANFRKGAKIGLVLPKVIVVQLIAQMDNLGVKDSSKSIFYIPVQNFPADFTETDKTGLRTAYNEAITQQLLPSYQKLADFLKNEYLPKARTTSGMFALPDGEAMYRFYIYYYTTTHKTPEQIHETGLKEVARITGEMERVKNSIGFKGTLKELFHFMKTDRQFMPFKTNEDVLNAYRAVLNKIKPHLPELFGVSPKTPFEIRAVEAFRAASSPPQYFSGSADGSQPGIFYVPIVDPTKINVTGWAMESVFLHEAIPGHHYQFSLQAENKSLPSFRRFSFNSAFVEGWGLYAESLGEKLGCYTDPYQKLGALGAEMHRAVRLVVDAAIHTGQMTREEAISYMSDHEALPLETVTLEIEKYITNAGQALAYKTGEMKIKELRDKYRSALGDKFSLKKFHDAILYGGSMPLTVFEREMDAWALTQK